MEDAQNVGGKQQKYKKIYSRLSLHINKLDFTKQFKVIEIGIIKYR